LAKKIKTQRHLKNCIKTKKKRFFSTSYFGVVVGDVVGVPVKIDLQYACKFGA